MRTKKPEQVEKMLNAAVGLFGTQRFHEVRMEDVAARAGVGKGTIYRYFEDKDELYLAMLQRAGQHLAERISRGQEQAETLIGKLEAFVAVVIEFFDEQPHVFDLIQRADALRGADTPWRTTRDEAIRLVRHLLNDANLRGEFAIADSETATLMLLGGIRSVLRFRSKPYPASLPGDIVQMFLFGADKEAMTRDFANPCK
jgi:AcrR family transcriptional regulator